jgi:exosortase B
MNASTQPSPGQGWAGIELPTAVILAVGLLMLAIPLIWDLSRGLWVLRGHEPLIAAVSVWLIHRRRDAIAALPRAPSLRVAMCLFCASMSMYFLGRVLGVVRLELLSIVLMPAVYLLLFKGKAALKLVWFPIFYLLFAIPPPFSLELAVTGPMKAAVSELATQFLSWIGYPIGNSGVVITIGQYQLLVNEACAGLQTMFTLEAMGLLYANLMNHSSTWRSALLAILVVPIAFLANVVRVVVLSLVTFHVGDAAGQGFLHGFAGMVLFLVALVLVVGVDALLGRAWPIREIAR